MLYLVAMSTKNKQRTYARNRIVSRRGNLISRDSDGRYLLKLVLVILLGSFWLKFGMPLSVGGVAIAAVPVGMLLGLILIRYFERYQFDRKIWYAILLVVTIICYFMPAGIMV